MPWVRSNEGLWSLRVDDERDKVEDWNTVYLEALPRYLTALDPAFTRASEKSEFEFLLSMLRVRGLQDDGWDPYDTTLRAIPALTKLHKEIKDFEVARHLQLWLYGHIVEASEPYELLANLIDVANGGRFKVDRFPLKRRRPQSPGENNSQLENAAKSANMPDVTMPLREIWNRDLRNSIFHADYILYGSEVRTVRPYHSYSHEEVMALLNRALAYHEALAALYRSHITRYSEPEVINVSPGFSADPEERAIVIVREGHGIIGLKDAWTRQQVAAGKIPFRIGRFYLDEIKLLDSDPELAKLPARPSTPEKGA